MKLTRTKGDTMSIKAGDTVTLRPEFQDAGDANYRWKAIEDEDGGRVRIQPQIPGMAILPTQVVSVEMLSGAGGAL